MDRLELGEKLTGFLKKYRYVALILIIGIILMLIPSQSTEEALPVETIAETKAQQSTQEALEEILSQIQGAGKVKVLLTVGAGELTVYQTDETSSTGESGMLQVDTVIVTDADKAQQGLVRQVNPPVYLGAVVVCQGADSAAVRLSITEAVSDATGLSTDKITVLKMK